MQVDATIFFAIWLLIVIWSYHGFLWGDFAERQYYRLPRLFRQVIPGREADLETYVRFHRRFVKIFGPIAIALGVMLLIASLLPRLVTR